MSHARNVRKKQLRRARAFPRLFDNGRGPASWNRALRPPARAKVESLPQG